MMSELCDEEGVVVAIRQLVRETLGPAARPVASNRVRLRVVATGIGGRMRPGAAGRH